MGIMLTFTGPERVADFVLEMSYLIPSNIYSFKL